VKPTVGPKKETLLPSGGKNPGGEVSPRTREKFANPQTVEGNFSRRPKTPKCPPNSGKNRGNFKHPPGKAPLKGG